MSWSPIELYYQHGLSGLVATTEESGHPVSNILEPVDGTLWKATGTATQYLTYDAGAGNTYSPDYLLIFCHNLGSIGATVTLQYSDNGSTWSGFFTGFVPADDKAIIKKFTTAAKRYTRLMISGATAAPWIAYCRWGSRTVLDYADGLTPYDVERKGNINVGDAGYVQGIHEKYQEWGLRVSFLDAEQGLIDKIITFEEFAGLGLFGISWDPGDHAGDVRVMRRKNPRFSAPLKQGGGYADIVLDLIGRKE